MTKHDLERIKKRFHIIGKAPALHRAIATAMQIAPTSLSILIRGENGTGKESFAKIIHHLSQRKHDSFIAVNCGAIPEGTMDSELFGHEKGSFTGASESRKGYFEEAHQGTLFLDEIGEMSLRTQPRLLRVLENKEFLPVGSSKKRASDARVITATNVNLEEEVQKGRFREDLYYRIAQIIITVPPLRERGDDIRLLFRRFTLDFAETHGTSLIELTAEAQQDLIAYPFPGNVRQLKNVAWQMAALEHNSSAIDRERLQRYLPKVSATPMVAQGKRNDFSQTEREMLYNMLLKMQQDSETLKQIIHEMLHGYEDGKKLIARYPALFQKMIEPSRDLGSRGSAVKRLAIPSKSSDTDDDLAALGHQEEESISIAAQEKVLIGKALEKWKNRKKAAHALGVAERTLYRKIKEYNL